MILRKNEYKKTYSKSLNKNLEPMFVENPRFKYTLSFKIYLGFETNHGIQYFTKPQKYISLVIKDSGVQILDLALSGYDIETVEKTIKDYYINRLKLYNTLCLTNKFLLVPNSIAKYINSKYLTLWELEA